jgi:hypothetical protein
MSMQLELFPRKELKSFSDFQEILFSKLSDLQLKEIISTPEFFVSPKNNEAFVLKHSKLVDDILDFRCDYYEQMLIEDARGVDPFGNHETWGPNLSGGVQSWIGLDLNTLQTPYSEIYKILHHLKLRPYQTVIDLGAAYGRMGVVIGSLFLKNFFIGFEFVKHRVDEGNRIFQKFQMQRSLLKQVDLGDRFFELPEADVYFIYDFGQVDHIQRMLYQIRAISHKRPIKIAVKGKYSNEIIESQHTWCKKFYEGSFHLYSAYEN